MVPLGKSILTIVLAVVFFGLVWPISAHPQQAGATSPVTTARSLGTVKALNGNSITLTTDAGAEVNVTVQPSTVLIRTAPGHKDLQGATPIQLPDVKVGDRMLARGKFADDGKSILATSGVLMKREDIAQKQEQEQEDWRKRGLGGVVKSVDPAARIITISTGTLAAKTILVHISKDTILRRYAPDSIKFDDAKPGTLDQIKPGDQLRARGNHSADGGELTAEEVVSGSFRNIAGTVASTDAANNTVTIADLLSKHPVTVKVGADSQLRKLPPMMAQGIAARLKGANGGETSGAPGAAGGPPSAMRAAAPPDSASQNPQGRPASAWSGSGGPRAGGQGDFQQMLNRMPTVTISDLQKGDAVILVTTEGSAAAQPTAITLLSGVEPILSAAPSGERAAMSLSPWSLSAPTGDSGP